MWGLDATVVVDDADADADADDSPYYMHTCVSSLVWLKSLADQTRVRVCVFVCLGLVCACIFSIGLLRGETCHTYGIYVFGILL